MSIELDPHDQDREFLAWLKTALPADLRAKWSELDAADDMRTIWKQRAIERALGRVGESLLQVPSVVLRSGYT